MRIFHLISHLKRKMRRGGPLCLGEKTPPTTTSHILYLEKWSRREGGKSIFKIDVLTERHIESFASLLPFP